MIIEQAILKLKTKPMLSGHGNSLRGYIASQFPQYDILHQHNKDGSLLYIYPRVQYRIIDGEGYIIGIEEGTSLIRLMEHEIKNVILKGVNYMVLRKQLVSENTHLGIADSYISYRFIKPWLALNEQNYQEYMEARAQNKKENLLKAILKGNILSLAKGIGYVVDEQINVTRLSFKETKCFLKGTPMLGFWGAFSVNFEIPDYFGLGKSVSRGFGTVIKTNKL